MCPARILGDIRRQLGYIDNAIVAAADDDEEKNVY